MIDLCECCHEEEATHQIHSETAYFVCYSCQLLQRDVEIIIRKD